MAEASNLAPGVAGVDSGEPKEAKREGEGRRPASEPGVEGEERVKALGKGDSGFAEVRDEADGGGRASRAACWRTRCASRRVSMSAQSELKAEETFLWPVARCLFSASRDVARRSSR